MYTKKVTGEASLSEKETALCLCSETLFSSHSTFVEKRKEEP